MPNRKIEDDISNYRVSVDSVEIRTNLDFFSYLEDSLENRLETQIEW